MSQVSRRLSGRINAGIALLSVALFAGTGSIVVPKALGLDGSTAGIDRTMLIAFLLNIALLLVAWRRSAELRETSAAREAAENQVYELAYVDHTTGLYNRRYLAERLDELRHSDEPLGLLLIDLDHFKKVNDLYGHDTGDALLRVVAQIIRRAAPEAACCARLGGDEFAILLRGEESLSDRLAAISRQILAEVGSPLPVGATVASISASVGISEVERRCGGAEWLLHRADIAMYEAKRLGRNRLVWFDAQMEIDLNRRNALEAEIRNGLAEHQFVPYYQPLINLDSGEVKGFEVLARWNHPSRGVLEPAEFIPIAEGNGSIAGLSLAVMKEALVDARDWPAHLIIAVNVSPIQFKNPLLAQQIIKLLTETGFPPHRLELEITESTLLEDQELALTTVETLKNYGVKISLDDFGTGYASLTQLRTLPFDRIKIDKSFIASLLSDRQSHAIVSAIANLGRNLGLPITAEGVETEGVQGRLQQLGCSDAQGWLFGKPVPCAAVRQLLEIDPPAAQPDAAVDLPPAAATAERRHFGRRGSRRQLG
jgi:diguanylate cyclase (GGDEF)-like protein